MAKKKIALTPAQRKEQRAQQITLLQNELNKLRADMLSNVATWTYEQMKAALERAQAVKKLIDRELKKS